MPSCKRLLWILLALFFLLLLAAAPGKSPLRGTLPLPESRAAALDAPPRDVDAAREIPCVTVRGVDLNTADERALMALPGVGETLAGRIVAWREENGPYRDVEDLLFIKGIGEKTLAKICGYSEDE